MCKYEYKCVIQGFNMYVCMCVCMCVCPCMFAGGQEGRKKSVREKYLYTGVKNGYSTLCKCDGG